MASEQFLPLEQLLSDRPDIPGMPNLFQRYISLKNYLSQNVYKNIGSGTSSEDGGIYTDHGIDHFNAVIMYAGKLVKIDASSEQGVELGTYEIFVLLVAILLHDAGNVFGRLGHEKKAHTILEDAGSGLFSDKFERKHIAKIAAAHGGKVSTKNGFTKDTISGLERTSFQGQPLRQPLIAAITRFADEICEDRARAATYLLDRSQLPKKSEVYHAYANSISDVSVDVKAHQVSLRIEVERDALTRKFGKDDGEVFLIDEVFLRLKKMYSELCYCNRFMAPDIYLRKIRATIKIHDEEDVIEEKSFEIEERGYPEAPESMFAELDGWTGQELFDKYHRKDGASVEQDDQRDQVNFFSSKGWAFVSKVKGWLGARK